MPHPIQAPPYSSAPSRGRSRPRNRETTSAGPSLEVDRIQTGVRIEKRMLKVLKALAELKDMTLGDLLEDIVRHACQGKVPFTPETLEEIEQLGKIYGLTLRASSGHQLEERQS